MVRPYFGIMKLPCLLFLVLQKTWARKIDVSGEISFQLINPISETNNDFKDTKKIITNDDDLEEMISQDVEASGNEKEHVVRGLENNIVTVGQVIECVYQVPEEKQIQALLSNMMNQLTKMFVNAHEMMNEDIRRRGETRYRVITQKQNDFIESIFNNMTQQYLKFYNSTTMRVDRTERQIDPCENQEEMKEIWKDLLDSSLTTFRQAALKCIDENLKARGDSGDLKIRKKMGEYLLRELSRIKMSQLEMLCDRFQLCFNDFVRQNIGVV